MKIQPPNAGIRRIQDCTAVHHLITVNQHRINIKLHIAKRACVKFPDPRPERKQTIGKERIEARNEGEKPSVP